MKSEDKKKKNLHLKRLAIWSQRPKVFAGQGKKT